MKYIKFYGGNGYRGGDWEEYQCFGADQEGELTEDMLEQIANSIALDWGETFEYIAEGYDYDTGWESDEAEDEYYEGVWGSWKEVSKEEYEDGLAN